MVKKNNKKGIQLFSGIPTQGDFGGISLIGESNGLVSGRPTREGFGSVVRAARGAGRLGGMAIAPITAFGRKKVTGFTRRKTKEFFAKKPTTKEVLEQEQKEIFKKLKKKRKSQKQKVKIRRLERQTELFELVPFK